MKKIKIGFLFISCAFPFYHSCPNIAPAVRHPPEQLVVPLSNPGKSYSLKVGLINGSIKVTGSTGKDIIIDVTPEPNSKKEAIEDQGNGMKKINPKTGYDITATENNNEINVSSNSLMRYLSLNLKIPQGVKLTLSTVNGGDIVVDNIRGELEINNVNGSIKLTNISGSVSATSVNGDVITTFKEIDPNAPMAFSTLNGKVDVSMPATAKLNVKMKSDRGEIFTDFDVDIQKTDEKVIKTSGSGMYQLKKDDWVLGKVNGGGPEVMMKNMQGNIYLRKSK